MSYIEATILALIEGITEFLPISSTGHLILTSALMGINEDSFVKSFNVIIQFGAILSVLTLYWKKFFPIQKNFYLKLVLAFLPAAIIGLLVKDYIDAILGSTQVVAFALILGGGVIILSDRFFEKNEKVDRNLSTFTIKECLAVGLIQCFAFIPGVSRAAATIIGGQVMGLSRKNATEFSFFLAVPTLSGAAAVKMTSVAKTIQAEQVMTLLFGLVLSYVFALLAIRFLVNFVSRHGMKYFGVYRIILGALILLFL